MKIYTQHFKFHLDELGLTKGATVTTHFARRDLIPAYVESHLADRRTVDVYVSEDCVIAEVTFR